MAILKIFFLTIMIHIGADLFGQSLDSLKCWSEIDKLKWNDFQGKIPIDAETIGLSAITSYGLIAVPFKKDDLLNYQIKLAFKKNKSWKTDTSDYLLSHEQLHFDIAELYARKLRKAVQHVREVIQNPSEKDFRVIVQKLYAENASIQDEYDNDTAHGIIKEAQKEWQKKISLELEQLKAYKSKPEDCR